MRLRNRPYPIPGAALALAVLLAAAPALPQAVVAIVPESGQFQCGQTWTVDVVVDAGATDLRGS